MRTIDADVDGEFVRVEPVESDGLRVNGIPADLAHTRKADVRIDLVEGCKRCFVAEHVLGPLRLRGITAANVVGTVETWDFARPEHRFCYGADLAPSAVVGHPEGLPNPALAAALGSAGIVSNGDRSFGTVSEPLEYSHGGGTIRIEPLDPGTGVELDLVYGDGSFACTVPPDGADEATIDAVTHSTTPYLAPSDEEAATHAVADVLSDVVVIGDLDDVRIEADLGDAYHALTIGAARRARACGAYVERGER